MNRMKAVKDFPEGTMDGDFKEGDFFEVNDERAFVLQRLGLAERAPAAAPGADVTPVDLHVPRQAPTE